MTYHFNNHAVVCYSIILLYFNMFSRQTVLAVLAASAALISVDAFAPAARPVLSVSFTCLRQTLLVRRVINQVTSNVWINNHQKESGSMNEVTGIIAEAAHKMCASQIVHWSSHTFFLDTTLRCIAASATGGNNYSSAPLRYLSKCLWSCGIW